MIKEDTPKCRANGFNDLQAEKSARLLWRISNDLGTRVYGSRRKEKTKDEENASEVLEEFKHDRHSNDWIDS